MPKRKCESAKSESECFAIKEASSSVKGISKFKLNFIERQGSRWAPGVTSWHCHDMTCLSSSYFDIFLMTFNRFRLFGFDQSHVSSLPDPGSHWSTRPARLDTTSRWKGVHMRAPVEYGWMIIPNAEETLPPNSDCTQIEFYFDYLRFSKVTWTGSEKAPIAIAGSRMLLQTSSWLQQAHTHQMKYWVVLCFEPDGIFQSCECLAPWTRQWTQVNVSQMGGSTWQFGARFW